MHGEGSKGQKYSAALPDSHLPPKPKTESDDSRRNSRNDLSGTTSGDGLLEFTVLASSQEDLKVSASQQKKGPYQDDDDLSLGYEDPDAIRHGKDKQTKTSVVALRKDGYVVVEEDMRTQQNVVVELHPASQDDRKPRVSSRPVPVGSGEYARLDPMPQPKHPPPIPPKASTPSSAVPYGTEDDHDWHFMLNGDEYAIAEVGIRHKSKSSDDDLQDIAYAVSDLSREEVRRKPRQANIPDI